MDYVLCLICVDLPFVKVKKKIRVELEHNKVVMV